MEDNYQGEFKDGLRHGQGTYTHPDIKYIGEWKDDKYHGNGTVNTHDGFKYVGEWENGLQNGQGKFTSRDGYKYEGEFKDSKYYGQGTEIFRNGKQYVGDWKDSNPHGKGTETFPDGRKYVGEFKDGLRHGQGTFTGSDRVKYEGEWKGGERNGFGVYTLSKVSKYVGEFDSGIKNGKGVNFPVNGEPQSGIWVEDKFREKWTIEAVSDFLNSKYPQFTGFNIDVPAEVEAVSTVPTPNPAVGTVKSSGSSISGVIAVIDFEGNNISSAEVRALTDRLRSELVTIGQFTIIERGQMDEVLKEQAFQQTGCVSSECAVEVGKLLGVENIITGSISRVGTIYSVSARAFSVASGEIIKTAVYDHSGDIGGLLTQGMRKVAEELGK
jgi:TolB-like protein